MKVLYLGYYREKSDWGRATINNILALDKAGVDVVCRSIDLNPNGWTPPELSKFENKSIGDATHCIQHVFPEHIVGSDKFEKNVAICGTSFVEAAHGTWGTKFDLVDKVWLPFDAFHPNYMPYAIDPDIFSRSFDDLNIPEIEDDFKFYTVVDPTSQKIPQIISAFHTEFHPSENASLVLCLSSGGDRALSHVDELTRKVKERLNVRARIEDYKKEVLIGSEAFQGRDPLVIHQIGDCYVSTTGGREFSYTEMEALGFGNYPIVADKSHTASYAPKFACDSIHTVLDNGTNMFRDTINGHDYNIRMDDKVLKRTMRSRFESHVPILDKNRQRREAMLTIQAFSLESVGQLMKEDLLNV